MSAQAGPIRRRPHVLIAGGGVAGVEALLALRALAGQGPSIELVSPDVELVYRPLRVTEPFDLGEVRFFALEDITADQRAGFRPGAVTSVDPAGRRARLRSGEWVAYDALLVATGARAREALPGARAFNGRAGTNDIVAVLDAVRVGRIRRLAFAVPEGVTWPLPLYELALLTAWRLDREALTGVTLTFVTPEQEPLDIFGAEPSARVRALLESRGIDLLTRACPVKADGARLSLTDGSSVPADHTITIPSLEGRVLLGLPSDSEGFIPVDAHGRVKGLDGVYAAGDGAGFPVKQGGLATQQADAAAEAITAQFGLLRDPAEFEPILRAVLLTGSAPLYLGADPDEGGRPPEAAGQPAWWQPGKIIGRYLSPYLAQFAPEPSASEDRDGAGGEERNDTAGG
jgi:sulfide:quinone oxidoreductase